jgi:hypothetical protein
MRFSEAGDDDFVDAFEQSRASLGWTAGGGHPPTFLGGLNQCAEDGPAGF